MADVNNVTLIGRLTRDADLRYTGNGKAVSKFSLAVNEKRKIGDQWVDEAGFFEIVLWGQIGESLNQYLVKGKQVAVTGRLTQERWEQDGQNRSKVVVTAATVQLLGGRFWWRKFWRGKQRQFRHGELRRPERYPGPEGFR